MTIASRSLSACELAGGVAGEGEGQLVGVDAAAVIDDADEGDAAFVGLDADAVAPASRAFSTSSLTMEAGRSTTSPAAMRLAISGGSTRIVTLMQSYAVVHLTEAD